VTDGHGQSATGTCAITIVAGPSLTCAAINSGEVGVPIDTGAMTVTGGDGHNTFSIVGTLPAGLHFDSTTGRVYGTPTASGNFSVAVTDGHGQSATGTCAITIVAGPSLTCAAINSGEVGVPIDTGVMTVTGGDGHNTFSIVGTLPAGLHFDTTTGRVYGTPTASGNFSVAVTDGHGQSATGTCAINIIAGPALACSGTSAATVNKSFDSGPMQVSGGSGNYTFFVASGAIPSGLTLNTSNGEVTGTATVSGSFSIGVRDARGGVATGNCPITITYSAIAGNCLSITAVAGFPMTPVKMTATGGSGAGYAFSAAGLPNGLTMASDGTISGTPTVSGNFPYVATVTDSARNTGTINCAVTATFVTTGVLGKADTATIGYWNNKNGQALIDSFNGGPTATLLGNWLAAEFPYLYGGLGGSVNLAGQTNAQIGDYFQFIFKNDSPKTSAQVLAGALAAYATSTTLSGGVVASSYGFNVSANGTGGKTFNVGSLGTSIGLVNNTSYTILQLLQQVNITKKNGTYNDDAFNTIFSDINQSGDIK